MATFLIRVLKGDCPDAHLQRFFSSIEAVAAGFEFYNVLADSETSTDLELRWTEERTINNVIAREGVTSLQINLEKTGYISVRDSGRKWYVSSLGRRSVYLSARGLASFDLAPVRLDLGRILATAQFKGMMLECVRISDLAVDTIPSLRAEIASCTPGTLFSLVDGTDARITSFAISPAAETHLTFSTSGTLKVRIPGSTWDEAIKEVEAFAAHLFPES